AVPGVAVRPGQSFNDESCPGRDGHQGGRRTTSADRSAGAARRGARRDRRVERSTAGAEGPGVGATESQEARDLMSYRDIVNLVASYNRMACGSGPYGVPAELKSSYPAGATRSSLD